MSATLFRRRVWAVAVAAVVLACGCAGRAPSDAATRPPASPARGLTLEFVDAITFPARPIVAGVDRSRHFGSVSGLVRDAATGHYLAVIDDRQAARVAWLDIRYDQGRLSMTPIEVVPLVPAPGIDARVVSGADLEAIAALPDGTFVVAEEGHQLPGVLNPPPEGRWAPALLSMRRDATVVAIDWLPDMFKLGPEGGGIRSNQGMESLTAMPDGRLMAGLERPRYADLPATLRNLRPFSGGAAGPGRLIEFHRDGPAWRAGRQWSYPLDATTPLPGFDGICDDGENGLTDLLALDNARLLALERACLVNTSTGLIGNSIRIYLADLTEAEDVSAVPSLVGHPAHAVEKTLVLDLATLVTRLPASLAHLDNFEALAFGPELPDGRRSVLVMSDDNFRTTQQTAIVLLALEKW